MRRFFPRPQVTLSCVLFKRATVLSNSEATAVAADPVKSNASTHLLAFARHAEEANNPVEKRESIGGLPAEEGAALVKGFTAFMRREDHALPIYSGKPLRVQLPVRIRQAYNGRSSSSLTPLQRQDILRKLCNIVEQRSVPLIVATRLAKKPWPPSFFADPSVVLHHKFIMKMLRVWIAEELGGCRMAAKDARAILGNCCFLLRGEPVSLVGNLATAATADLEEVKKPDALISLMWAVHNAGTHAPDEFWRRVVNRLLQLNTELRDKMSGVVQEHTTPAEAPRANRDRDGSQKHARPAVGHVFSGLSTRQIYRLVEVLRREKWCGGVGALHGLVDQALKNIVFETEANSFGSATCATKSAAQQRVQAVADLSIYEFLELLKISADFGIPFSVSGARVSECLLTPLVTYLDRSELLTLMQVAAKTRCHSVPLVTALAEKIRQRGPTASYALPLCKSLIRTIVKDPELFPHLPLSSFVDYFLVLCDQHIEKVRADELASVAELLYGLSRRFAPSSAIGQGIRETMHYICRQMDRLLQLRVVSPQLPTKCLEYTIVMGMRHDSESYPHVADLLAHRNAAVKSAMTTEDDATGNGDAGREDRVCGGNGREVNAMVASQERESLHGGDSRAITKAATHVYDELTYLFERMAVIKATLLRADFQRFTLTMEKTGLYNILVGADLMRRAHLCTGVSHKPFTSRSLTIPPLNTLPAWLEKRVSIIVAKKIREAKLTPSSSDDQVLHVLGQMRCDTQKVQRVIFLLENSPFYLLKKQQDVWAYVRTLAQRFGTERESQIAQQHQQKALY